LRSRFGRVDSPTRRSKLVTRAERDGCVWRSLGGEGVFMVSGANTRKFRRHFKPQIL
jgi:hypothetical protein